MRHIVKQVAITLAVVGWLVPGIAFAQVSVLTQRYDSARDGLNASETTLTPSSVGPGNFGKLFNFPVDGYVYAQPLYMPAVTIPNGGGTHNLVFVATEHGTLYAYDADGLQAQPLWQVSLVALGCPTGFTCTSVPASANGNTTDLLPEIGITSTPIIDSSTGTVYAVAKSKEVKSGTTNYTYRLHALDVTTGLERTGSPVAISGSVSGATFSPLFSLQRPGLALASNTIFITFGSWGDDQSWYGWVFGYDKTSLGQVSIFNAAPSGTQGQGGIWMSGSAPAVDASGYLYLTTGNGAFNGTSNYGDSLLKLATPGLTVFDYFTPFNQQALDNADLDLASGGVTLLPDTAGTTQHPHIAIACGKNGTVYVLDRDSLGHFNSTSDSQIIQELPVLIGGTAWNGSGYVENCYSTAAYWQGNVYFVGITDAVKRFTFTNGQMSTSAASQTAAPYAFPGASPVISANGSTNGILWAIENAGTQGTDRGGSAVLHAYDAITLGELYNSTQVTGDAVGPYVKFSVPTVANGKVYVGTQNSLAIFGPTSATSVTVSSVSPNNGPGAGGTAVTITGTNFAAGATVTFGGTAATGVTVVNSTTITATTPAHAAGAVTVAVTVNAQTGSLSNGFTYIVAPTVTSVSPNSGTTAGGTAVTITGTNFATGATVTFGAAAATNVVVSSSTTITATSPAGSAGAVTVTVTNPGALAGSLTNGYTYVVVPTVTSVSPNNGPPAGGTAVTITGTNFATGATVTFGGTAATGVTVVNSTTITATTPAHAAGAVTVAVTVNAQTGSLSNGFTYIVAPTVTSVSPNSGTTAGGTAVTITGTNFATGATVTFGAAAATNVVVSSSTTITATSPAGSAGAVTVTVTNPGALSGSLASGYTYVVPPTVTSVSPNSGTTAGGTAVTITGANFATGATVTFGGTAATGVTVVNSTTITAATPAHAAGAVTVAVTVNGQSGSLASGFTYTGTVTIGFAQVAAATPQSPTATVSVSYPGAQTGGNLNVVVVGWNDSTSTVQSVKDSAGNSYSLAIGPTSGTGVRQSIYYAANIVGGANTVTVTFNQAAAYPDIRILEYRGVTTLDATAGASGTATAASSGAATTTVANELIFGANTVATGNKSAGTGFTSRIITTPDSDLAEDKIVTTTGSNSATATLVSTGPWVMQMVTFSSVSGPVPTVTSVSPSSGTTAGGTAVTVTGTNFVTGATVTFGSAAATGVTVVNATTITATAPAGAAGAVTVTVNNPGGQSGSLASAFTYVAPPTVTSVSPNSGTTAGGTAVTITGTNFAAGATVTFGGTAATNVVVTSATTITATTPAGVAGAVAVAVTNPSGLSGSLASGFTYLAAPTVTSVSPNSGSTAGGTAVTITGTNFATGATVTFGGTAATNVVVVNATTITATTPAGSAGAGTVTVTVSGQSGSLTNGYTYVVVPTVTSVSPNNGGTAGGTAVTITGTNFAAGATVTFGGTAATNVVVVNSTTITATTPAGSAGAVTVTVTVNGQSGSLTNGYSYVVSPTVTSVSPNSGTTLGGTAVTITGTNFATGATVTFGGAAATNVAVVNSTTITATTPAGSTGAVTVTVTNPGALSGSLVSGYTYVVVPTVSSVSPNSGSTLGGTAVTITGTNFATGATVTFGGTAATGVTVVNSTTITATTPAHAAGAVTVAVTVNAQTGSLSNGFTYIVAPTVTSVSPNSGTTAGGTAVTITGTNFATGATVTFGAAAATNVVVSSSTTITATSPAGSAGAVTVTVTNPGALSGSLASGYTYVVPPTVTSVSPNSGTTAGGTAVTITGANFATGATVTFGGTAATGVTVVNSTTITAATPAHAAGAVTVAVTVNGQSGSLASGFTYTGTVTIGFAQVAAATPQSPTATVSVSYPGAQTGGNLNVVVVGWNDSTSTVQSVKDSAGNSYSLAIGPTSGTGVRQSIYYAANIVGGANTVTVTFNQAAAYPDIRILEYRGVTTLDATAGASGTATAASSGAATTTVANELIFGANTVATGNKSAGTGFTSRIITTPDSDLAEDKIVTTTGSNSATATLVSTGPWVMQMVTFSSVSGPVPTVTSVSPSSGTTAGGTAVTVTGTNFVTGATVTFGSAAATGVTVVNATTITATAPAGAAGAVTVTVNNPGGQSGSLASAFTYVAPPTVTSVSPNSGTTAGGTAVTITGTNFAAGATVTFGGTAATNVVVTSATTITATTPAGVAGAVAVAVTNPSGLSGSLASGFTYLAAPTVTSVSPNSGSTAGGTAVTITGTNFATGATVTFGGTAATNVVVVNATTITATTPAGSAGAGTVTVTVSGQSGSLTNGYTYVVVPTVTSVSPNNGGTAGGTAVTITGTNFAAGATVTFGGTAATNVVVVNSTTITATTPAGSAGAVTVTVTVNGQSGSLTNGYSYVVSPTVTSVSPNSGTTLGGTAVTITGTNFATGATVTFGGAAATNVAVVNSTTITATTPAGSTGAVTVTVTNPGALSGSLVSGYTYVVVPTVSSVSPNSGSTLGGTAVTITGTNFATGATVTFGGTAATGVTVVNSTTITATTPTGSGTVAVTVTVNGQSGSLANGFAYGSAPTAPGGLTAGPGTGPIVANVQGYYNSNFQTTHTTATFDSTGGDLIVLFASSHFGVTFNPSDNFGNTWISVAGPTTTSLGFDLESQIWYAQNPLVGTGQMITMNLSQSLPLVMSVFVVKGSNISSPLDAISMIGSDNGTQNVNVGSPGVTTKGTNDLLIGFTKVSAGSVFQPGTGFTQQPTASSTFLDAENGPAATPGTYAATFTVGSPVTWEAAVLAVANNPNQTSLTWTASTESGGVISNYLVERCQGLGCSSFVEIGTPTATSFNDTGLTPSTNYSYRVRAKDTTGNMGPYSSIVNLGTPATIPSLPGNLVATAPSSTEIDLSWMASTETGGSIGNYLLERCLGANCTNFAQVGAPAATSYRDIGLTNGNTYNYRVRAADAVSNLSPYSNVASATAATPDTQPPTAPGSLAATAPSSSQINLSWTAATDNVGVTGYYIERCQGAGCTLFFRVAVATGHSYSDTGLSASTTYLYRVRAIDAAGNLGPYTSIASATTLANGSPNFALSASPANPTVVPGGQVTSTITSTLSNGFSGAIALSASGMPTGATVSFNPNTIPAPGGGNSTMTITVAPGTAIGSYSITVTGIGAGIQQTTTVTLAVAASYISYVQGNYADPQSSPSTVSVTYTAAQTAGNLNVVVVGWNDSTATVSSVTDTAGNVYTLAVGPTAISGVESQSIYYAKNIAAASAGANVVTVTFSVAAAFPDIRVLEYGGADPTNPVDVTAASSGNSSTSSSGSVTTTNASDLIFGANLVQSGTNGPGSGFTSRLLTVPDSDIVEDEFVTAIGSYSATAPDSPANAWIMQMVAFRAK